MDENIQSAESLTGKKIKKKMLRSWSGEIAYIIEEELSSDSSAVHPKSSDKRNLLSAQKPMNKANVSSEYARIEFPDTKPTCGKQTDKSTCSNKQKCLKKMQSLGTNTEGHKNLHICNNCKKFRINNENYFKEYLDKNLSNNTLYDEYEKHKKIYTESRMNEASYKSKSTNTPNKRRAASFKTDQCIAKPKLDILNEIEHTYRDKTSILKKTSGSPKHGKTLNQFKGGILNQPVLMANTNSNNQYDNKFDDTKNNPRTKKPNERRHSQKRTSFSDFKQDGELIKILPPLLQPPISTYSKKCEDDVECAIERNRPDLYKEADRIVYPRPMELIRERKSFISNNDLCEQRRHRNSLKSNFEKTQEYKVPMYRTISQNSIFQDNIQSVNFQTEANMKKSQYSDYRNVENTSNRFQPTIRTQAVDFTPFLTQLLESCLKIPYALNNIRNANNTFVSDLKRWKTHTQNIIDKTKVINEKQERNDTGSYENEPDNQDCTICNHCHNELERLVQLLNKKQPKTEIVKPAYNPCNCNNLISEEDAVTFQTPKQFPTYVAQCHIPYYHKMQSEILEKIHQMKDSSSQHCPECSELKYIQSQVKKPRCAFMKEESSNEEESDDCSHCSSCCSIFESNC